MTRRDDGGSTQFSSARRNADRVWQAADRLLPRLRWSGLIRPSWIKFNNENGLGDFKQRFG